MHQNYNSISQKIYETSFIVCNPKGKYYFCSDLYPWSLYVFVDICKPTIKKDYLP